jgi:3-oxoacyl-[acyl-carrier protein] reductase
LTAIRASLRARHPALWRALRQRWGGITLNTVNPGPVDTGYAAPDLMGSIRARFPAGRWGEPDDPARLIAWLATDEARWVTGQVIHTEGAVPRWS